MKNVSLTAQHEGEDTKDVVRIRPETKVLPEVHLDRPGYSSKTEYGGASPYV